MGLPMLEWDAPRDGCIRAKLNLGALEVDYN